MYKLLIVLGLAFTFAGCATNSSDTSSSSVAAVQEGEKVAKEDEKPKIICKRTHRVGTNFKTKQCWTAEEYAERQEHDQEFIKDMQNSDMDSSLSR